MTTRTYGNVGRDLEWLFAGMMVAWGIYLWMPMETFAAPQYALLSSLAGEKVWAAWSFAIGVGRIGVLLANGHLAPGPMLRCIAGALGFLWWVVLTFLFLSAPNDAPAGVAWYPLFAAAELLVVLRAGGDTIVSGSMRRKALGH